MFVTHVIKETKDEVEVVPSQFGRGLTDALLASLSIFEPFMLFFKKEKEKHKKKKNHKLDLPIKELIDRLDFEITVEVNFTS